MADENQKEDLQRNDLNQEMIPGMREEAVSEKVSYQVDPDQCEVLCTFDLGSLDKTMQEEVGEPLQLPVSHPEPETQGHDVAIPISSGHQTNLTLFEAPSLELVQASSVSELTKSSVPASSIVFSTPNISTAPTHCSTPAPNWLILPDPTLPCLQQIKPSNNKNSSSMSQGKLKVINHGIQSENIQSPVCHDKTMAGKKKSCC